MPLAYNYQLWDDFRKTQGKFWESFKIEGETFREAFDKVDLSKFWEMRTFWEIFEKVLKNFQEIFNGKTPEPATIGLSSTTYLCQIMRIGCNQSDCSIITHKTHFLRHCDNMSAMQVQNVEDVSSWTLLGYVSIYTKLEMPSCDE